MQKHFYRRLFPLLGRLLDFLHFLHTRSRSRFRSLSLSLSISLLSRLRRCGEEREQRLGASEPAGSRPAAPLATGAQKRRPPQLSRHLPTWRPMFPRRHTTRTKIETNPENHRGRYTTAGDAAFVAASNTGTRQFRFLSFHDVSLRLISFAST